MSKKYAVVAMLVAASFLLAGVTSAQTNIYSQLQNILGQLGVRLQQLAAVGASATDLISIQNTINAIRLRISALSQAQPDTLPYSVQTVPATQPAVSQLPSTPNGNGAGGNSFWQASGNNIFNTNTGNVGIGTTAPTVKLDVKGNTIRVSADDNPSLAAFSNANNSRSFLSLIAKSGSQQRELRIINDGPSGGAFRFTDSTAGADRLVIDASGKVGIGTTNPQEKLDLGDGNIKMGYFQVRIDGDHDYSVSASCPAGKYVVGGGCRRGPGAGGTLISSYPDGFYNKWTCEFDETGRHSAYAICANIR